MAERKPLSKKIRFEVFKRDKFTCQYCGRKAPEKYMIQTVRNWSELRHEIETYYEEEL